MIHIHSCGDRPFQFLPWEFRKVEKLFAGCGCIMAITKDGRVLQKVLDQNLAARTEYWTRVVSISISPCIPALAVGLISDGTCMVTKRPLRAICEGFRLDFDQINGQIKELKDIVEIRVSDGIFALDKFGSVHHICLSRTDDYKAVDNWQNIRHIAVGNQNAVFGITRDGKVLCTGGNLVPGLHHSRNVQADLDRFSQVLDVCAMGSECENIYLALADGRIVELYGGRNPFENIVHSKEDTVFCGNCLLTSVACPREYHFAAYCYGMGLTSLSMVDVQSLAVGTDAFLRPFVVWNDKGE